MIGNLLGLLVLVALVVLFGWLAKRAWGAKRWFVKWPSVILAGLVALVVMIGQRIGMIRFGSQVDLAIPDLVDCEIDVKPGQFVRAGLTVIARYGRKNLS